MVKEVPGRLFSTRHEAQAEASHVGAEAADRRDTGETNSNFSVP
jgi:hypothetical protein